MESLKYLIPATIGLLLTLPPPTQAQVAAPYSVLQFSPRVGISTYIGDLSGNPNHSVASYSFGVEGGYRITPVFALNASWQYAEYPRIVSAEDMNAVRQTVAGTMRFNLLPGRPANPYINLGGHVSFGGTYDGQAKAGFGPTAGFGVSAMVSDNVALYGETIGNFVFPDDVIDGREGRVAPFDILGFVGAGVRFMIPMSRCVPVNILAIEGAGEFPVAQVQEFSVRINPEATESERNPVEYVWDLGDGSLATGRRVSHAYERPGTYTVAVTATNCGGPRTEQRSVSVTDPCPQPITLARISADNDRVELGEPIVFSAETGGTRPIHHRWDFGDGTTSTDANPAKTYERAGTYTVRLDASNCGGTESRTMTVRVQAPPEPPPPPPPDPCDEIARLNTVYFAVGSTTLDAASRRSLLENVDRVRNCPNTCIRIFGYADPSGSRALNMRLTEQRAAAVEAFYIQNGIPANRLDSSGLGQEDGGDAQSRRVESTPHRCGN